MHPINARNFGTAADRFAVKFHDGEAVVDGYIVKQTGTRTFMVASLDGTVVAARRLAKSSSELDAIDTGSEIFCTIEIVPYVTGAGDPVEHVRSFRNEHSIRTVEGSVVGFKRGVDATEVGQATVRVMSSATLPKFSVLPSISGTGAVGSILTATPGTILDGVSEGFEWRRDGVAIDGAETMTYTVLAEDQGTVITFVELATGTGGSVFGHSNEIAVPHIAPIFTTQPSISGTPIVGQTLTLTPGAVTNGSITGQQWRRDGVDIAGATALTYVVASADAGKAVSARVSATGLGGSVSANSNSLNAVLPVTFATNPTISGNNWTGQTLTRTSGTVSGAGAVTGGQWMRAGVAISGATAATYVLVAADEGKAITYRETASGAGGTANATSNAISAVAPVKFTANPTIAGNNWTGQTLTSTTGTASGGTISGGQWMRDDAVVSGATAVTYVLVAADEGKAITYRQTATGPGGPVYGTSAAINAVAVVKFTANPAVTGNNWTGSILTTTNGTVTGGSISGGQWLRDGVAISGATATTYTLVSADDGKSITFRQTATGPGGPVTATSNATAAVTKVAFTTAPSIAGNNWTGQTLTGTAGVIVGGTLASSQWMRDGSAIAGASGTTYVLTVADQGKTITYQQTATGPGGPAVSTSNTISAVAPVAFTASPTIAGNNWTGQTLTATTGTVSGGTISGGQWRRDGVNIGGATAVTYVLVAADEGKAITYQQSATGPGGPVTATSSAINAVAVVKFTSNPVVSGNNWTGQTLTAATGVATGGSITGGQWRRAGTNISGATAATYVLVAADEAKAITYQQTATGPGGPVTATSNTVNAVAPVSFSAAPTISGDALVGSLLTATLGTVAGGTSAGGQWMRDTAAIAGETGLTYTTAAEDVGASVTYRESATGPGGPVYSSSNAVIVTAE